mmetsp:Transcript_12098/g.16717  ORF Transcript_12098/g.16717 Transcript_12098/m.16717 type:complete len:204 (+) Transcript_12098:41-652(+)
MDHKPIILLICCLFFFIQNASAFSFGVDATREECFYEDVAVNTPVSVMFQVIQGGFLDVDVQIRGPVGAIIYNAERQTEGKYNFVADTTGTYSFCFGNRMSTLTPKVVSLSVVVADQSEDEKRDPKLDLDPVMTVISQLKESLRATLNEQDYMKMREKAHRNTSESTNERVIWWSIFEVIILFCMSVWQIYYLRRFFEVKRVV